MRKFGVPATLGTVLAQPGGVRAGVMGAVVAPTASARTLGSPRRHAALFRYHWIIGRTDPFDLLGLPQFIPRLGRIKAHPALMFFDRAVATIIARRRRLAQDPANVPDDILTRLLEAQDPETGQAMSEAEAISSPSLPPATKPRPTISWVGALARAGGGGSRARDRGPVEGLAERLVETRGVIEEAVRLYPPLATISSAAVAADELSGCGIKPGAMVLIAPYLLHRHRLLWERPDEFDPNRFPARGQIDRFTYLPCGVGPRICIGSGFALQEATLVVATVMKHFRLEPVHGRRVWPVLKVTLRPDGGLPVVVRRRNAAH
jgi:cytochrome P450